MSDIISVLCCECGVPIYMQEAREQMLRRTHADFYCLNGHKQAFLGSTRTERERDEAKRLAAERQATIEARDRQLKFLRAQLEEKERTCEHCDRVFATVSALKGHNTRAHGKIKMLPAHAGKSN